jgi:hypothetical protein
VGIVAVKVALDPEHMLEEESFTITYKGVAGTIVTAWNPETSLPQAVPTVTE